MYKVGDIFNIRSTDPTFSGNVKVKIIRSWNNRINFLRVLDDTILFNYMYTPENIASISSAEIKKFIAPDFTLVPTPRQLSLLQHAETHASK